MITNKGNQIITKYMLGQAPEYAAYIAVGVGAKPLAVSQSDTSPATKKSMDFEAFRIPVLSRGIVNDTITIDLNNWTATTNLVIAETSVNHGIKVGDVVDIAFSASANFTRNVSNAEVVATTSNTIQFAQTVADGSWTTAPSDTATVTYVRDKIIFKAQLPPDQHYQMTEIAIYPAANNQLALGYDSKNLAGFIPTEGWTYHNVTDTSIAFTTDSLVDLVGAISASAVGAAVFTNATNELFVADARRVRYESPRLFNKSLLVKGDLTTFTDDTMTSPSDTYISTSESAFNFSKNSPDDYVKLALSIVSPDAAGTIKPYKVRVRIEFIDIVSGGKAYATHLIPAADINASRYQVVAKQLKDFVVDSNFSWARISKVSVYAQTATSGGSYDGSYLVIDGLRLDNENTENTLYGMVCYSILKNVYEDAYPIEKIENSQGYIEYRLGVSVY